MRFKSRGRFNVKRWSRVIGDRLRGTPFDRLVERAKREGRREFALGWNRGLGDIALGLVPLFAQVRESIPGSRIVVFTRGDLTQAFALTAADAVHAVPDLARDRRIDVRAAAAGMGVALASDAIVIDDPDPTRWLEGRRQRHPPVLHWRDAFDAEADALLPASANQVVIGAHVASETAQYYGYVKDWPLERWQALISRFPESRGIRWLLFGHARGESFTQTNVVDLRGRTSFLALLAVVRTRCSVLVAPDSGVLTAAYYLEGDAPLQIVSLWSDPRQGVLKQRCASPNPNLRHIPLVGRGEDVRNLSVDDVAAAVETAIGARAPAAIEHAEAH